MTSFWRRLLGADSAPARTVAAERRSVRTRRTLGFMHLEGRQLLSLTFAQNTVQAPVLGADGKPVTNAQGQVETVPVPGIEVTPRSLPNNGTYVPVTLAGEFSQTSASVLAGSYAVTKYPYHVATNIAHQATQVITGIDTVHNQPILKFPTKDPTQPATMRVRLKGYDELAKITPTTDPANGLPALVIDLPVPTYELQVIFARLQARPTVKHVTVQVTDQYRQDEPLVYAPVQLNNSVGVLYNIKGNLTGTTYNDPTPTATKPADLSTIPSVEKIIHKGIEYIVRIPNFVYMTNTYTYSTTFNLQASAHSGTGGRQYIIDAAAVDADDGGAANVAVVVPQ